MLYILRPAIHALAMRQFDSFTTVSEETERESDGQPLSSFFSGSGQAKESLRKYAAVLISLVRFRITLLQMHKYYPFF